MKIKKFIAAALCLAAAISVVALSGCSKEIETVSASALTKPAAAEELRLTAHRGLSSQAPENSLAALRLAGSAGYYACEFDIYATSDGVWVLMHDESIDRMTNGSGKISEMTYAELKEYKLDSGNGRKQYPDEKIPNLSEALDVCEQYSIRPMIEIKSGTNEDIMGLMHTLTTRNMLDSSIIISFDASYLENIRKDYPDVELWLLVMDVTDETVAVAKKNSFGVAFSHGNAGNLSRVAEINDAGLVSAAWTVDELDAAQTLYNNGVRYITTNRIVP